MLALWWCVALGVTGAPSTAWVVPAPQTRASLDGRRFRLSTHPTSALSSPRFFSPSGLQPRTTTLSTKRRRLGSSSSWTTKTWSTSSRKGGYDDDDDDPAPFASTGLYGDWEPAAGGSYVLYPSSFPSLGVVHFLGGAFVGAASQLTYRYLLERLANLGYVVIATPYRLSFDYLSVCDAIQTSFDAALDEAKRREPELLRNDMRCDENVVVSVGHSCGALLHALLATRDDLGKTTRKRLALISYNNKGATDAVPLFEQLVVPLATEAMRDDGPTPLVRRALGAARDAVSSAIDAVEDPRIINLPFNNIILPSGSSSATMNNNPLAELAKTARLVPLARQSLELADQLPDLLQEVADGARDFDPPPAAVRDLLRTDFVAKDALLIQFADDAIDESDDAYATLRDAVNNNNNDNNNNRRNKEENAPPLPPPPPQKLRLARLDGTHLTPLTQDIFIPAVDVANLARDRLPITSSVNGVVDPLIAALPRDRWLGQVDAVFDTLKAWLLDDDDDEESSGEAAAGVRVVSEGGIQQTAGVASEKMEGTTATQASEAEETATDTTSSAPPPPGDDDDDDDEGVAPIQ